MMTDSIVEPFFVNDFGLEFVTFHEGPWDQQCHIVPRLSSLYFVPAEPTVLSIEAEPIRVHEQSKRHVYEHIGDRVYKYRGME